MRRCAEKLVSLMPRSRATAAVCRELGMPTTRRPAATRAAKASRKNTTVLPLPRPKTMPSLISATARSAASRFSASRSCKSVGGIYGGARLSIRPSAHVGGRAGASSAMALGILPTPPEDTRGSASAPQRFKRGAHLGNEISRLFPGRKMPTLGQLVVMEELGISLLRPALWRLVDFVGKRAHGDRDLDAAHIEETAGRMMCVVPVKAR